MKPHVYIGKCKQNLHSTCHEIAVFFLSFSFLVLFCCQCETRGRAGKEDSHIWWWCSQCLFMSLCGQICCFLVWANLLMLWWNITSVTVFNPIGSTNIISRCLIILNVGSAQRELLGGLAFRNLLKGVSTFWVPWLFSEKKNLYFLIGFNYGYGWEKPWFSTLSSWCTC